MIYNHLGRSGLKVSRLCLGAMMFGGPADEADSPIVGEDVGPALDIGSHFEAKVRRRTDHVLVDSHHSI